MIMDDLYLKDSFINDNIPYLFNANIIEYDMKDAGFSLTREYKLLSDSMIEKLDKMDKEVALLLLTKIENYNTAMPKLKMAAIESYNNCIDAFKEKWKDNKKAKYFRCFYTDWEDIDKKYDNYFSFIFFCDIKVFSFP